MRVSVSKSMLAGNAGGIRQQQAPPKSSAGPRFSGNYCHRERDTVNGFGMSRPAAGPDGAAAPLSHLHLSRTCSRISRESADSAQSSLLQLVLPTLPSLLQRTRATVLALLLVVLPLQSVMQLAAGFQNNRHVHTGSGPIKVSSSAHSDSPLVSLVRPLRALLDRLHADQDPRLKGSQQVWVMSRVASTELHEHGGVFHKHSHDTNDVLEVGDSTDDSTEPGSTAFLAWLPTAMDLVSAVDSDHPIAAPIGWRDRVVAPPLTPPRG